jgi:hypothetical protein
LPEGLDGAARLTGIQSRIDAGSRLKWYDYRNRAATIG